MVTASLPASQQTQASELVWVIDHATALHYIALVELHGFEES